MEFYLVDIKDISTDVNRSQFTNADIEALADAILASKGLIYPLILKQQGIDSYTVVTGHLEYYAAARAREKNPRQAEMVNALVISAQIEAQIKRQTELLTTDRSIGSKVQDSAPMSESKLTNLELRLEQRVNEIQSSVNVQIGQLKDHIKELEQRLPQPEDPLHLFNTLTESQLALKLQRARISNATKLAKNILTARTKQPQQHFGDYRSIVDNVKGFGDKTLLNIIDAWHQR
jgi:hypothetical protein